MNQNTDKIQNESDPQETQEWLESLVVELDCPGRRVDYGWVFPVGQSDEKPRRRAAEKSCKRNGTYRIYEEGCLQIPWAYPFKNGTCYKNFPTGNLLSKIICSMC